MSGKEKVRSFDVKLSFLEAMSKVSVTLLASCRAGLRDSRCHRLRHNPASSTPARNRKHPFQAKVTSCLLLSLQQKERQHPPNDQDYTSHTYIYIPYTWQLYNQGCLNMLCLWRTVWFRLSYTAMTHRCKQVQTGANRCKQVQTAKESLLSVYMESRVKKRKKPSKESIWSH